MSGPITFPSAAFPSHNITGSTMFFTPPANITGAAIRGAAAITQRLPPLATPHDVAAALSRVEADGPILALWLPMAVFGHIFSMIFLIRGLFLYMPKIKRVLREKLLCVCCYCPFASRDASATGAVIEQNGSETRRQMPPRQRVVSSEGGGAESGCDEDRDQDVEGGGGGTGAMEYAATKALETAFCCDDLTTAYDRHHQEKVTLEWRSVTLAVSGPRGVIPVLRDVGGRAPGGAVTALLGPSGAGKSTLLDLLALRGAATVPEGTQQQEKQQAPKPAGASTTQPMARTAVPQQAGCSGQVLVNGVPRDSKAFLAMSSYVPQEDAFLPQLTVREALLFTGRLVLQPPQCSPKAVSERAAAVAAALGLGPHLDSMIGGVLPGGLLLRGLSGGERKRLSIGQGLMSRPRVLLLDEPTSGLDSFAATVVMGHVAALATGCGARGGVTVVASLHQPRAAIWDMVNQVVVLGRGRLLYCGPPLELLSWFGGRLGYCYRPEHHGLISDWIMDLVALAANDICTAHNNNHDLSSNNPSGNIMGHLSGIGLAAGAGPTFTMRAARVGSDGSASVMSSESESGSGPQVMASLAELNAAADAFAAAVLAAASPAPGVSAGVPDYANVLRPPRQTAVPPTKSSTKPSDTSCKGGKSGGVRFADLESRSGTAAGVNAAPPPRPPPMRVAAAAAAAGRWFRQYRMLVWREWLIATRNPADVAGRMLTFVWVGLVSNFLTYGLRDDASSIAMRSTLLFALVFFFLVMPFVFVSLFAADKRFFLLEASARGGRGGLYAASAYYAAKVTATAPLNIAIALTFDWIGYGMLGMRSNVLALARHTTCAVLMSLISLHWVQAAVAFSPNQDIAFCASVAFSVLNLLLSTQFLGAFKLSIPWIGHLRAISALDHSWRGLMWAEFHNRAFECGPVGSPGMMGTDALGLYPQFLPANSRFSIMRYGMNMRSGTCVVNTNGLLSYYDVDDSTGVIVGYLFSYLTAIHVITYIALRRAVASKWRRAQGPAGGCSLLRARRVISKLGLWGKQPQSAARVTEV